MYASRPLAKSSREKRMRLIGIKLGVCDHLVRKILKDNTWYPFGDYFEPTEANGWEWRSPEQKQQEEACKQMYKSVVAGEDLNDRLDITVNCIVGKNGSGKSTLLDIFYRIINNFSWKLIDQMWYENRPENNPQRGHHLCEAEGFDATLFYETDGYVGSIRYYYGNMEMNYHTPVEGAAINGEPFVKLASKKKMEVLTRHFFYSICTNYSIHSLNQRDYTPNRLWINEDPKINGKWIQGLFHKNDGYVTPIVMVPYRTVDDYIDIDNENDLAKQRLATLAILFGSQNKRFMNVYKPNKLVYRFDHDAESGYNIKFNKLFKERLPLNKNCSKVKYQIKRVWKQELKAHYQDGYERLLKDVRYAVINYLAYKTLKTCLQYRSYGNMLGIRSFTEDEKKQLKKDKYGYYLEFVPERVVDVVKEIVFQESDIHINLKIHQLLTYVKLGHYETNNLSLPEDYAGDPKEEVKYGWSEMPVSYFYNLKRSEDGKRRLPFRTFDEVSKLMPPSIFEWDINFTKGEDENDNETLTQMSSGERQFMQSISYIIYHLKNLQSVTDGDYRIRYHNVCMVFDEAELYYHPEFQRKFISSLVQMLSWSHINPNIIRGINIVIATHSPFVLSDVPLQNTLYLDGGNVAKKKSESFCANVHEMLGNSFFMDYTIGEIAKKQVEEILRLYNDFTECKNKAGLLAEKAESWTRYRYVACLVADEYLHGLIGRMMDEMEEYLPNHEVLEDIDKQIMEAEKHLEELKAKKEREL